MKEEKINIVTVDEYINQFEEKTKEKLISLRSAILDAAPQASEKIAWGAPTYSHNGYLVQFAANKKHIGFYCSPGAITYFKDQLHDYKTNKKNTIQSPIDKDIPMELVKDMVRFRIKEKMS